ncbi:MAG: decaprenyl-phosphate phosphoribosyltransferase [Cetobacterium sp.]
MLNQLKNYLKLMRVKHWIKNLFIFIPLFFSKNLFNYGSFSETVKIFFIFSLASSLIYIINDMCDIEKDKAHPRKCTRPLASGVIKISSAKIFIIVLVSLFILLAVKSNVLAVSVVIAYIIMNILYSVRLKHEPIIDVLIIAMGFIFRVVAGGFGTGVILSSWLLLTIFSLSTFLGFGKRRNELLLIDQSNQRKVLQYYNVESLDNFTNIFSGMFLIFYCLYSFEGIIPYFYITIPLVVYGLLKYNLLLKDINNEGDPTEILFSDTGIKSVVGLYSLISFFLLYFV